MAERNVRARHRLAPVMVTLGGKRERGPERDHRYPVQLQMLSNYARFPFRAERRGRMGPDALVDYSGD